MGPRGHFTPEQITKLTWEKAGQGTGCVLRVLCGPEFCCHLLLCTMGFFMEMGRRVTWTLALKTFLTLFQLKNISDYGFFANIDSEK